MVVTTMASSSFEASAASLPSSMVLLRCNHGSELETPFTDKTVMKRKVQAKLSQLPPDIGRHLTLKKVHIKENGWSLLLFFEIVPEAVHAEIVDLMKSWVGIQGSVRFLTDQETATLTILDYSCDYCTKRQPMAFNEVKECSESSHFMATTLVVQLFSFRQLLFWM